MTSFLFVRHGETFGTKSNIFGGGESDPQLTKEGYLGTEVFVRKLDQEGRFVDACLTSRLLRTKAFGICYRSMYEGPVFADQRLNEKKAGVFEGCNAEDFYKIDYENKHQNRWITPLPCGESHREVALRVIASLKFWEEHFPDLEVLVGSHTDVIRAIEAAQNIAFHNRHPYYFDDNIEEEAAVNKGYPTDEQLTLPIPYFHALEINPKNFCLPR